MNYGARHLHASSETRPRRRACILRVSDPRATTHAFRVAVAADARAAAAAARRPARVVARPRSASSER